MRCVCVCAARICAQIPSTVITGTIAIDLSKDDRFLDLLSELEYTQRALQSLIEEAEWREVELCPHTAAVDNKRQTTIDAFFRPSSKE